MKSVVTNFSKPGSATYPPPRPPLCACKLTDFLAKKYPKRPMLLSPWLPSQGLAMVHAQRGIGKTFFALSVGLAVASGTSVFGWMPGRPKNVLYIDGEMAGVMMRDRLSKLVAGMGITKNQLDNFHIFTLDDQEELSGGLNLADPKQRGQLEPLLGGVDLVIVDNVSCLYCNGDENNAEHWEPMNQWLLTQRRSGRSVLLVHHSGKGGQQRGTSRREDILDTVLCLNSKGRGNGARFRIEFEKCRSFTGESADPIDVVLKEIDGSLKWELSLAKDSTHDLAVHLFKQGLTQKQIADKLGKNKATISRHLARAKQAGDLPVE